MRSEHGTDKKVGMSLENMEGRASGQRETHEQRPGRGKLMSRGHAEAVQRERACLMNRGAHVAAERE